MATILVTALICGFIWRSRWAMVRGLLAGVILALIAGAFLPQVNTSDRHLDTVEVKWHRGDSGIVYLQIWHNENDNIVDSYVRMSNVAIKKRQNLNTSYEVILHKRGLAGNLWLVGLWLPSDTADIECKDVEFFTKWR